MAKGPHCSESISIQSKGFLAAKCFSAPSATSSRSATNSMYSPIRPLFMPIRSTGSASVMNSRSIATASVTIASSRSPSSFLFRSLRQKPKPKIH